MPDPTVVPPRLAVTDPRGSIAQEPRVPATGVMGGKQMFPSVGEALKATVATLSSLGDAVVVTTIDGSILLWTDAAESVLGVRTEEAVGQSFAALLDPIPAGAHTARSGSLLNAAHWQGAAMVLHRDTGRTTVHLSLTHVPLSDGANAAVDGIILRVRPFPERATPRAEGSLDPALLEQALEQVSDIVLITAGHAADPAKARIVYVNHAFERITGYRRDEVLGRSPALLRGPDTDRSASDRLDAAVRDRQRTREELLNYTKLGEPLWLDVDVSPVDGPDAAYMQWVAVERDVTAQKGHEVALRAREERLRLALNAVWDGLWDWHVPTGYCYYAPRWYSMLGFAEHSLPPHIDTFLDLLHPQDLPVCEKLLRDHFEGRADTYAVEVRLRTVDNRWRWVLTRGTVVERDQHGRPVRMVGTHTDIAERKQAELALHTSEDRFRTLTMASPLGIFLADATGLSTFVTPRMRELWAAPVEALLGRGFRRMVHADDRARVHAAWQQAVRDGDGLSIEYRVQRPDGEVRWVSERTAAHRDGDTVTGFVGTVEDVTAQKVAEEDRRRLEVQMQHAQKLESLGVLAGGIAHDFNNLLVGVLGNVSVAMADVPPGSDTHELLGDIELAARRAAELTTQLLAYAGKGRFNLQPIDLSAAVRETSSLLHSAISKRAILSLDLAPDMPMMTGDGTQVRQVIMNLLTNASEALEEQPGEIMLRTGCMQADGEYLAECLAADDAGPGAFVYVEVADTGIGMSADTLSRIFDPFFTTKFTGRGLGLAATLGIVRGHHGALHVRSAPGAGTVIRILFPAAATRASEVPPAGQVATPARTGTILLVDDDPFVRDVATRMLERSGYRVIGAVDGDDGLRLFAESEGEITAMIVDVTMPHLSGIDVLAELRRRGTTVPVVLASGYSSESLASPVEGEPFPVFVQKPFVTQDLLSGIDAALARRAVEPVQGTEAAADRRAPR
jgi:PAS domain S-box-containing protein